MAQKLQIDIVAKDKSTQALQGVRGSLSRLKNSVFSLQSAFLGLGAGLAIRSLINTGKQIEELQVKLKFLFGSAREGAKAFDEMAKFAAKVPFSLEEIQSGSGVLAVVSKDAKELANLMEITGNVAAVTGLDFKTTSEQIQRSMSAGISAADLFRDRGVKSMLGFKAGAVVSIKETQEAFERVFGANGKFGGATKELAKTLGGTISMIGDKFFNFKRVLLDNGFFNELKNQFGELDQYLASNSKKLDILAKNIGEGLAKGVYKSVQAMKDLIPYLQKIGSLMKSMWNGYMALPPYVRNIGLLGAFLLGKKGAVGLAALTLLIDKIQTVFNGAKESLGIFDKSNPEAVSRQIELIKEQLKDIKKISEEEMIISGGKITITKEDLGVNSNLEESLLRQLKSLQELQFELKKSERITHRLGGGADYIALQFEKLKLTLSDMVSIRLVEMQEQMKDISTTINKEILKGIQSLSKAMAESVVHGKNLVDSFKAIAQGAMVKVLSYLIEQVALMAIQKFFKLQELDNEEKKDNLIRKQNTNLKRQIVYQSILAALGGGGGFLSTSGGSMKKELASGGSVQKGQPYMVGERGAELFVPNQSGQIQQSARGGSGGGSTTVNFNINTVDARGFNELLTQSRGTITQLINQAVNERGAKSII